MVEYVRVHRRGPWTRIRYPGGRVVVVTQGNGASVIRRELHPPRDRQVR